MCYDRRNKLLGVSKGRNRLIKHVETELRKEQRENEETHNEKVLLSDFLCEKKKQP